MGEALYWVKCYWVKPWGETLLGETQLGEKWLGKHTVQATEDIKQAICPRPTTLYSQTSPIVQANGDIKQPNKSGNYTSTTKIHKS